MHFVKVTTESGTKTWINLANIAFIQKLETYTLIAFNYSATNEDTGSLQVKETPEEILK